jgi:hypothetical protein
MQIITLVYEYAATAYQYADDYAMELFEKRTSTRLRADRGLVLYLMPDVKFWRSDVTCLGTHWY